MALVTTKEMFRRAYEGGYAIGAFNINNMEIIQAITEAAEEAKSPLFFRFLPAHANMQSMPTSWLLQRLLLRIPASTLLFTLIMAIALNSAKLASMADLPLS